MDTRKYFRDMAALILLMLAITWLAVNCSPAHGVIVGASRHGNGDALRNETHTALSEHAFGRLDGKPITDARFVNIEPEVKWSDIAAGHYDAELLRWAEAIKATNGHRLVSFSHEPTTERQLGSSLDFKRAWRHVVTVFDNAGATKVEWVWNVTWASIVAPTDRWDYAGHWWPGRAWVDDVSAEVYNWQPCSAKAPWASFASKARDILAFAEPRGSLPIVIGEFGMPSDPRRAQWLNNATRFMSAHASDVRASYYFNSPGRRTECEWALNTQPEYDAMRNMVTTLRGKR